MEHLSAWDHVQYFTKQFTKTIDTLHSSLSHTENNELIQKPNIHPPKNYFRKDLIWSPKIKNSDTAVVKLAEYIWTNKTYELIPRNDMPKP